RALGRTPEALGSYDRALELQPAHLTARASRGLLLADLGRADDVGRDFTALIEAAPASPDGYLLRAWLERTQGRFSESERDLAEARTRGPGRWEAFHNAGVAAVAAGRWADAERNFELTLLL